MIAFLVGLFVASAFWCGTALAHRVNIFAWVEGDTVYTESKFSGGRKAMGAPIEVFDDRGNRLIEGKTDAQGGFAFKVPKRSALKIVLHAGAGHQNHWAIPLSEIDAAMGSSTPATGSERSGRTAAVVSAPPAAAGPQEKIAAGKATVMVKSAVPVLSPDEIQSAVEKALDRKLKPLILRLNRMEEDQSKPALTDVFGGIGYILGLMGIAAWVRYRKSEK